MTARECSEGGVEMVERQDMATLRPTKWLNDNIVNFEGGSHDITAARARHVQGACVQFTLDGQAPWGGGPDNPV